MYHGVGEVEIANFWLAEGLDNARRFGHLKSMWITYLVNGIAAIGGGLALFVIAFAPGWESKDRPNVGFWTGVLTVALAIAIDFPLKPEVPIKSIGYTYTFALIVFFILFGLGRAFAWAEK